MDKRQRLRKAAAARARERQGLERGEHAPPSFHKKLLDEARERDGSAGQGSTPKPPS